MSHDHSIYSCLHKLGADFVDLHLADSAEHASNLNKLSGICDPAIYFTLFFFYILTQDTVFHMAILTGKLLLVVIGKGHVTRAGHGYGYGSNFLTLSQTPTLSAGCGLPVTGTVNILSLK